MSENVPKLVAPLWAYRLPPNGLTNEWQTNYLVLITPATCAARLSPLLARDGTCDVFEAWSDTLRQHKTAASAVLGSLLASAPRTWRAGHAILLAVNPISAAIVSTARFLVFPRDNIRKGGSGVGTTRHGREATADFLRKDVAEKLNAFQNEVVPLLDELAAAVLHDCAIQRGQPSDGLAAPKANGVQNRRERRATSRKAGNPANVWTREQKSEARCYLSAWKIARVKKRSMSDFLKDYPESERTAIRTKIKTAQKWESEKKR